MGATYQVAVNNFLADGGDNFGTFAEVDPLDRVPGPQDIDALTDYLGANSPVAPPPTDRVNEIGTTLPTPIKSLTPARLLETRIGPDNTTVDGLFEGDGRLAAGGTVELVVAGRGGVADDASAVVLNLGAILPDSDGFLTVYPCGEEQPLASNVNYYAGDVVSNAVLAKIGDDGKVCIYTLAEVDLIADVNSEVAADGSPTPVSPARILETRDVPGYDTVDGLFEAEGRLAAGETLELVVAGRGGVPDDAKAVLMNLGAVLPSGPGFLTVFPCGDDQPLASSVNYDGSDVVSNTMLAKIGDDGKVCIYTLVETDLIADVNGFVPVDGSPDPLVPARLLETRVGEKTVDGQFQAEGRVGRRLHDRAARRRAWWGPRRRLHRRAERRLDPAAESRLPHGLPVRGGSTAGVERQLRRRRRDLELRDREDRRGRQGVHLHPRRDRHHRRRQRRVVRSGAIPGELSPLRS